MSKEVVRSLAVLGAFFLWNAAHSATPSLATALDMLSQRMGVQLNNPRLFTEDAQPEEFELVADMAGAPVTRGKVCQLGRVAARFVSKDPGRNNWGIVSVKKLKLYAARRAPVNCSDVSRGSFYAFEESVDVQIVPALLLAVDTLLACAKQQPDCTLRISGTPWSVLDEIADFRSFKQLSPIEMDRNLSTRTRRSFAFYFADPERRARYLANIIVDRTNVDSLEVARVLR
jgi:hypothetical protein